MDPGVKYHFFCSPYKNTSARTQNTCTHDKCFRHRWSAGPAAGRLASLQLVDPALAVVLDFDGKISGTWQCMPFRNALEIEIQLNIALELSGH